MLLRTTTTVIAHQRLGCDRWGTTISMSHSSVGHWPCQAGDCSQVKGEKGVSGINQYPVLLLSTEELLREKLPGLNNHQSGNKFMWKTLHFQSPLASNQVLKKKGIKQAELEYFSPQNPFFVGCRKAGIQKAGQTTRESSSGFIHVKTKNGQRISKTPDKIIDLFFCMLFEMRESRHISSSGTVLICWQHSWTWFLIILREEWMARESLSNHHCCELQRNWHQRVTSPSHWGKEQRFYWTGCSVKYSWT